MNKPERLPEEETLTQLEMAELMGHSHSTQVRFERDLIEKIRLLFAERGLDAADIPELIQALRDYS
jgi:transcriptional regulator with XRE-family HTH domain